VFALDAALEVLEQEVQMLYLAHGIDKGGAARFSLFAKARHRFTPEPVLPDCLVEGKRRTRGFDAEIVAQGGLATGVLAQRPGAIARKGVESHQSAVGCLAGTIDP
jgi:hypothetical protein